MRPETSHHYTLLDISKLYDATIPDVFEAEPLASEIWC
jgi:hypothetical protein